MKTIRVETWLYGPVARYAGEQSQGSYAQLDLEMPAGSTMGDLLARLGLPMEEKGITDPDVQKAIIRTIIDEFSDQLAALAGRYENAVFVDMRGTVRKDHWHDEIHPDSPGFQQVALKFIDQINATLLCR